MKSRILNSFYEYNKDLIDIGQFLGIYPDENIDTLIMPVSYDSTTTALSGTRFGAEAIIRASRENELYLYDKGELLNWGKILTLPLLPQVVSSPEDMINKIYENYKKLFEYTKKIILLGGEHSLTYGAFKAYSEIYPGLTYIVLDAHLDFRDSYQNSKFSHACISKRVFELANDFLAIGVRSCSINESNKSKELGLKILNIKDYRKSKRSLKNYLKHFNSKFVYLSIDIDVLDPSVIPTTGTPVIKGLLMVEFEEIIETLFNNLNIVGFDFMEYLPLPNFHFYDYIASQIFQGIIYYYLNSKI